MNISLALSALLALSVHAKPMVVGSYIHEIQLPESTCKVVVDIKNSDDAFYCSATLISPTKILTATHCFSGEIKDGPVLPELMSQARVKCSDAKGVIHEAQLDPQEFMFSIFRTQDTTLAELKSQITDIPPMKVATESELKLIMSDSTAYDCAAIGYGLDNAGKLGTKHGVTIKTPLSFRTELSIEFSQTTTYHPSQSVIQHGDSGGTLACRLNNEWVLIGVNTENYLDPNTKAELSGAASAISVEKLYAMRDASKTESANRVADYSRNKQNKKTLSTFANESTKLSELYKAGYSLKELIDAGNSIQYVAKKTGASTTEFVQSGLDRRTVIEALIPMFPRHLDPFKDVKPGEVMRWNYTEVNGIDKRDDAIPCSTIQMDGVMMLYDADVREIRDDKQNVENKNRRVFSSLDSAEEYLIGIDPRCQGKGLKSFIDKNKISVSELQELGMSDYLIKKLNAETVSATAKRNPAPRTTQDKKPAVMAIPKQH